MLTVARLLELSLASTQNLNWQAEREHEIGQLRNPFKRLGAKGIHYISATQPDASMQIMQAIVARHGLEYLGCGFESSVYKRGDEVIKVHRNSVRMPQYQKEFLRVKKQGEYQLLSQHLGSFLLSQSIVVDVHPLGDGHQAVQTLQPYCDFSESLKIFRKDKDAIDLGALDELCRAHPGIEDTLRDFVEASFTAADQTNCLPDTNGVNNLVIAADAGQVSGLKLIDTQPITPSFPDVQILIRNQLSSLQQGLLEVA